MKSKPKKGVVLKWLLSLRSDQRLRSPTQIWCCEDWYKLFKFDTEQNQTLPLFSSIRFFTKAMNSIAIDNLLSCFQRNKIVVGKNIKYSYSLDVTYTNSNIQQGSKCHICIIQFISYNSLIYYIIILLIQHSIKNIHIQQSNNKVSRTQSTKTSHRRKNYIKESKTLNFSLRPRTMPSVFSRIQLPQITPQITVQIKKSRFTEPQKWAMISTACDLGATDIAYSQRLQLFRAVIRTYAYFNGFPNPIPISVDYFRKLFNKFQESLIHDPMKVMSLYESHEGEGKVSYINKIITEFPTYLHGLYRYATSTLGATASTKSLVRVMNRRSMILHPNCAVRGCLSLNNYHFWKFFHMFKGKLLAPTSKPRLTPKHKQMRIEWATRMKHLIEVMGEDNFHICFVDEKWFYTTSRRKKMKILPKADFETEAEAHVPTPRLRSRRYALKVMHMGLIGKPVVGKSFNGKIYLRRVSESHVTSKNSFNQHISPIFEVNHSVKMGEWKKIFTPIRDFDDIDVIDAIEFVSQFFELFDVQEHLVFSYKTHSKVGKKKVGG